VAAPAGPQVRGITAGGAALICTVLRCVGKVALCVALWTKLSMLVVVLVLLLCFWVVCGVCTGEVLCGDVPAIRCLTLKVLSIFHVMMQPGVLTLLLLPKVDFLIPGLHGMVYWCMSCLTSILLIFHWIVAT
jgi:hypothetical protein